MAEKALIVLAHPAETSLSRLFACDARLALEARGADVTLLDLYASGFAPSLTRQERTAYYGNPPDTSKVEEGARLLSQATTLILVFPTWWFGMPAILKGWLDRVFAPGVAFDHADEFGPIKPRLTNLRRVIVVTTLGSPAWIDWLVMRRPVRRILKTAVFGLCAPQAKFVMLSLYRSEKAVPERIKAFSGRIVAALPRQ